MNLFSQITELEQAERIEKCCKCEEYRNGFEGPYCVWRECECDPEGCCDDFEFADFWRTKRGY